MFYKFPIWLVASLFIFGHTKSQSSVILIKTHTNIFVGADSKEVKNGYVYHNGKKIDTVVIDTACKILKEGNVYFSMAGYDIEEVVPFVRECCKHESSIDNI